MLCMYLCCAHRCLDSMTDQDKLLQKFQWWHFTGVLWGSRGRDLSHSVSGMNIPALSSSTLQPIASEEKKKERNLSRSLIFHKTLITRVPGNFSISKKFREILQPSSNPNSVQAVRGSSKNQWENYCWKQSIKFSNNLMSDHITKLKSVFQCLHA